MIHHNYKLWRKKNLCKSCFNYTILFKNWILTLYVTRTLLTKFYLFKIIKVYHFKKPWCGLISYKSRLLIYLKH